MPRKVQNNGEYAISQPRARRLLLEKLFFFLYIYITQNSKTCSQVSPVLVRGLNGVNGHNALPGRDGRDGAKDEKGVAGLSGPQA